MEDFVIMKKIIYLGVLLVMIFSFYGCGSDRDWSKDFDLSDPKEFWAGTIDDDFEVDRVVVIMKKTTVYPELELRHFELSNGERLEYSNLKPQDNMLNDLEYIERYRQIAIIYLKQNSKEKVIEAVYQLSKLEFVKYAGPEMLYTSGDG
jgi:hypothetical protein